MTRFAAFVLVAIFVTGCGGTPSKEDSSGFIEYSGKRVENDNAGVVTLPVSIADGETAKLEIGATYASGSKSGRSSCDVTIKRVGLGLQVTGNGQGGAPIVWQKENGKILQCTKTLTKTEIPITYTYVIQLENALQDAPADADKPRH